MGTAIRPTAGVFATFRSTPPRVRDVHAAGKRAGYSRTILYRGSERAGVRKIKDGMRGGWIWQHPDNQPPEDSEDSSSQDVEPSEPSRNLRWLTPEGCDVCGSTPAVVFADCGGVRRRLIHHPDVYPRNSA